MAALGIVIVPACWGKSVYVFELFLFSMFACLESNFRDHFRFQGFEEHLDSGIIHSHDDFLLNSELTGVSKISSAVHNCIKLN